MTCSFNFNFRSRYTKCTVLMHLRVFLQVLACFLISLHYPKFLITRSRKISHCRVVGRLALFNHKLPTTFSMLNIFSRGFFMSHDCSLSVTTLCFGLFSFVCLFVECERLTPAGPRSVSVSRISFENECTKLTLDTD